MWKGTLEVRWNEEVACTYCSCLLYFLVSSSYPLLRALIAVENAGISRSYQQAELVRSAHPMLLRPRPPTLHIHIPTWYTLSILMPWVIGALAYQNVGQVFDCMVDSKFEEALKFSGGEGGSRCTLDLNPETELCKRSIHSRHSRRTKRGVESGRDVGLTELRI
jgi:hypothetical protein